MKKNKLVYGVGINDADYPVLPIRNASYTKCPYYVKWKDMLGRAYSEKYLKQRPSYSDVSVCQPWWTFSIFKDWAVSFGDIKGLHLDKDILILGNKEYSPEGCAFVPNYLNTYMIFNKRMAPEFSEYPLGVYLLTDSSKRINKYQALCGKDYLGVYPTIESAHKAWQNRKIEQILGILERYRSESCFRLDVEKSLLLRVDTLKVQNYNNIITRLGDI